MTPSIQPVVGQQPTVGPAGTPTADPIDVVPSPQPAPVVDGPTAPPVIVTPSANPAVTVSTTAPVLDRLIPSPPPAPVATSPPNAPTVAPVALEPGETAIPVASPPAATAAPLARDLPATLQPLPPGSTPQPAQIPVTSQPVNPDDIPKTRAPVPPEVTPSPATILTTPAPLAPGSTRAPVPTSVPVATPAPSASAPSVSGVMTMSTEALAACEEGCQDGLAVAFDIQPYLTRCSCPEVSRRMLGGWVTAGWTPAIVSPEERGYLRRRLQVETAVPFTVTVPGINSDGLTLSINHFQGNYAKVSARLGVNTEAVEFSALQYSATAFAPITADSSNTDIQLIVGPPASDPSAVFLVALMLGTCGCILALLGLSRQRMKAKKASDAYLAAKVAGFSGSVSGASGSASVDDEYYNNHNPVRTAGMLGPHGRAVAPVSIKAVSPTPSQTKQTGLFTDLTEATPPHDDPIYTEMIGTLGLFGTFYMSTEDMNFCAMRLYSNFKQAQENMERHAILDSIDVMPEIYDILRHCEESHLTADEKSLLATQLAPHWTNSEEARRALETAVVYTEAEADAEFWQGLQVATDALSRYDQIIVTARIVLMFDGSSGQSAVIRETVPLFQQVYRIIRSKCPQWHEGNVQLMGVYLAITFLEYGLNSQTLGVDGQSTTLDWVHGLQPDDLEKFLAEKKDQRLRVLCLDLDPTGIPQQALQEEDDVVKAAHSIRSGSSRTSAAQMELPFQGADDAPPSSALSPQGLMSVHEKLDNQSMSFGGSMPTSPGSSLHSSNLLHHTLTADNSNTMRPIRGGVSDSAPASVITSNSSNFSDEQSVSAESPLSRMSAHSYSLTSPAQIRAPGDAAHDHDQNRHAFNSGTTRSSRSGTGEAPRGGSGQTGGIGNSSSFASSRYDDVYQEDSSVVSDTPEQAMGIFYPEEPSGRNLMLPQRREHSRESGAGSGAGGSGRGSGGRESATGSRGRDGDSGGRFVSHASPSLGNYRERPSGRGLVQSSSEYGDSQMGDADDGGSEVSSVSQQSEGSSAWNDTDAQSVPASYRGGRVGGAQGSYGGGPGIPSVAQRFVTGSRTPRTSGDTMDSQGESEGGLRESGSSPVVKEVELYEDDLSVSEGSVAASMDRFGSDMTYGQDTAAGSSLRSYALDSGVSQGVRGAPASGVPGHQRQGLGRDFPSESSLASRVQGPASALGSHGMATSNFDSWRNSPGPGGHVGDIEHTSSGDTANSSALEQHAQWMGSGMSQGDGDFGTVWLANRANARQFDERPDMG
ncbi:unnamed protein product [Pylaiella littoralis]